MSTVQVTTTLGLRLYVHGWTLVDAWTLPEPKLVDVVTIVAKRNFTNMGATSHKLRIDAVATSTRAFLQLQWSVDGSAVVPLPSSVLSATVSAAEEMRQSMQANMSIGWNTWSRPSATAHVHLPTGFGFDVAINDTTTGTVTTGGVVDRCETLGQCVVRPGAHEYNGSYTHLTQVYAHSAQWQSPNLCIPRAKYLTYMPSKCTKGRISPLQSAFYFENAVAPKCSSICQTHCAENSIERLFRSFQNQGFQLLRSLTIALIIALMQTDVQVNFSFCCLLIPTSHVCYCCSFCAIRYHQHLTRRSVTYVQDRIRQKTCCAHQGEPMPVSLCVFFFLQHVHRKSTVDLLTRNSLSLFFPCVPGCESAWTSKCGIRN